MTPNEEQDSYERAIDDVRKAIAGMGTAEGRHAAAYYPTWPEAINAVLDKLVLAHRKP